MCERFRLHFNLPPFEALFFEVPAKAATFDTVLIGQLYLSYSYLSFYCEFGQQKAQVLIALRDIVHMQRAFVGKSAKETHPNIVPFNPNEHKHSDFYVLEVFTNVGQVHQFYSIPNFDSIYASVESTWRNCNRSVAPPLPQVVLYPTSNQPVYTGQPVPQQQVQQQPQVIIQQQRPQQVIITQQPQQQQQQQTTTTVSYKSSPVSLGILGQPLVTSTPVITTTTTKVVYNNGTKVVNPPNLYPNSRK